MVHSLAQELGKALNTSPLAIEIIPGNGDEWLPEGTEPHKRFLLVEDNLGVPQKVLYKAYLEATALFRSYRPLLVSVSPSLQRDSDIGGLLHIEDILNVSSVLILLNPGHNTAWNARKTLILSGFRGINQELALMTALLTVHECAKHSLLWHHRRWLLRRLYPLSVKEPSALVAKSIPNFPGVDDEDTLSSTNIPLHVLEAEFSACTLACSTYNRNYFGWLHRFRCLDALASKIPAAQMSADDSQVAPLLKTLQEESSRSSRWIDQHISDYTAMQYQCRLQSMLEHYSRLVPQASERSPGEIPSIGIFGHAESLVKAYPSHEALWLYLRGAAQIYAKRDGGMIQQLERVGKDFLGSKTRPRASLQNGNALEEAERHAHRLLAWLNKPQTRLTLLYRTEQTRSN
ncbi:hypothetical protein BDY19DRAFT_730663 [Irpex rosettiformis]|uniref:Uncharacterized protein n=1 Tax=Irpex rosettiformis TaxID=378272 RepID=A0ACB8U8J5_9APHY|nr:hypothetical protein BDY19DRAFT_730663 [Irpex rosettiformis]